MPVDFEDFFDGRGFEEGRRDALFDTEDYAVGCGDLFVGEGGLVLDGLGGKEGKGKGKGRTPMAVDPSLMASREYSTWKRRPSGEKVLGEALALVSCGYIETESTLCRDLETVSRGCASLRSCWSLPYSDRAMNMVGCWRLETLWGTGW